MSLEDLVNEWLCLDQNKETRGEIERLWDNGDTTELEKRMRHRIEFGTAGLRGRMEAGWSRMNDLIIIQASQGLCTYVMKYIHDARSRGIVVGHDHRHNSQRWAQLTAAAFIDNGVKVYLYQSLVHTPMVPFGMKRLNAACGVMITASHNPKEDNGYKVYWENGVQIIGPHDKGISDAIKENLQPRIWTTNEILSSPLCIDPSELMRIAYVEFLSTLNFTRPLNETTRLKFVNSSMHGVSDPVVAQGFKAFGFQFYLPVKEQQYPDPDFPTVKFPNPEEKGALNLALKAGDDAGASYAFAQDPDADRFVAAEKTLEGKWFIFTGDQLGTLFAAQVLERYKSTGKPIDKLAMVATVVSSKMIEAMAKMEGFKFVECLTGFKFIGNVALDLVDQGFEVLFGYEEAIGFMIGSEIRDKDGISATLSFAELVVKLHAEGKTAKSYLLELYQKYGYFETSNGYFICHDISTINDIFSRIRSFDRNPPSLFSGSAYPTKIAGLDITGVVDLTTGFDSTNPPTYKPILPLSSGHMIQFRAENKAAGIRITLTIRTSGTEPKIKYYLEGNGTDSRAVSALLPSIVEELSGTWLEAQKNGLLVAP